MNNIYFIGYRGVGKSTIAEALGKRLAKDVVHMDEVLKKRIGPIDTFAEKNGWDAFRKKETKLLKELQYDDAIIDCGGGIIENDENRAILKKGRCIWLKASIPTIKKRLKKSPRPALTEHGYLQEIEQMMERRMTLYAAAADHVVHTEKPIKETVEEVLRLL